MRSQYITLKSIGIIHTPYKNRGEVPIQGALRLEVEASIEVFPEYERGLNGIEDFSHIIILYFFHRSKGYSLTAKPYLGNHLRGIFSIRSPRRPNPIGLSVVKLLGRDGNVLRVAEVDILDGTPLLDIKPYVPRFDCRTEAKMGWLGEHLK
jgi:tRNA-Thr(GGU) m(6)t(6)A37 methyltransferase TsaA